MKNKVITILLYYYIITINSIYINKVIIDTQTTGQEKKIWMMQLFQSAFSGVHIL